MTSILAAFALLPETTDETGHADRFFSDLGTLERRFVAQRPRRAGRTTRIACIGASRCLAGYDRDEGVGERLGVFHGTALGNPRETREVVVQVVEEARHLPSPIRFSCSMANMSSFFVAQVIQARGPNVLVSQGDFSFEGALLAAMMAREVGECEHVLVGGTDGSMSTREDHLGVYGYPAETQLGEGSGWLLLGPDSAGALGELLCVELLPARLGEGTSWAREVIAGFPEPARAEEPIQVLPGPGITEEEARSLAGLLPGAGLQPYLGRTGIYPTACAAGIADLFTAPRRAGLYGHVARNGHRQTSLTLIRVRPEQQSS